ncbi:hypothetical protein ES703_109202 [subsurface metagenome]
MTKVAERGIETPALLQLAGISSSELHNWVRYGVLPAWQSFVAIGGGGIHYRYPPEAVELARKIKAWRAEGIPYRQIRELLRAEGAEL